MKPVYYNEKMETMPRAELRRYQGDRFLKLINHLFKKSNFYRQLYLNAGIKPEDIKSLDDIKKLPFIDKRDFKLSQERRPPYGDYTGIDLESAVTLHGSSGTTGKPMLYLDSGLSWEWVADLWAYSLVAQGVGRGSKVFLPFSYSTFIGFWGAHYGVEKAGAVAIPAGGFDTKTRIKMMIDMEATNIIAMPSYALIMGKTAEEMEIDLHKESRIIGIHHAAEPGGSIEGTKKKIESYWINSYDNYGMVELGSNSLHECIMKSGMHVVEDHFILEVVHPETREPVNEGETGELIWTNIGLRGFDAQPLVRCSSKDLARYTTEPCTCGRKSKRIIGGILGRTDHTKKVKGVLLYPTTIENVLSKFPEIGFEWEAIIEKIDERDEFTVKIEVNTSDMRGDEIKDLKGKILFSLKESLLFSPNVEFVPIGEIGKKFEGVMKPNWKRIIDKREVPF